MPSLTLAAHSSSAPLNRPGSTRNETSNTCFPLYFVVIRGLHFQNVPITSYTDTAILLPEHDSLVATQNLDQTMPDRASFDGDFGEKSDQVTH